MSSISQLKNEINKEEEIKKVKYYTFIAKRSHNHHILYEAIGAQWFSLVPPAIKTPAWYFVSHPMLPH